MGGDEMVENPQIILEMVDRKRRDGDDEEGEEEIGKGIEQFD